MSGGRGGKVETIQGSDWRWRLCRPTPTQDGFVFTLIDTNEESVIKSYEGSVAICGEAATKGFLRKWRMRADGAGNLEPAPISGSD
jgi:hypothetical protein